MQHGDHELFQDRLPVPLTPFIGRHDEVDALAGLLRSAATRLVTLTGPGGVGKTRLALEGARASATAFPDGIWFVDLAPLRDPEAVVPTITQTFGVRPAEDELSGRHPLFVLQGKRLLLVLDNFEQVAEAAPHVSALLAACPGFTVLVTSREPLKVGGEREIPVEMLPVPPGANRLPYDQACQIAAVRLFADRAEAALPHFSLTIDNIGLVLDICRLVDGLPLAIELAAARLKALPLSEMRTRLEQRLPILGGHRRDVPERQQTMRGTIAWSYELLIPAEQALFRRLGVFVGGCTLAAAEQVTARVDPHAVETLDSIASLVDKSLLRVEQPTDSAPRYLMLETVREYAAEALRASDEYRVVRDAHAEWCIELGERWRDATSTEATSAGTAFPVPHLGLDYDNVRAALGWMDSQRNDEGIARLVGAVWWFWLAYGHRSEGRYWLTRANTPEVAPISVQLRIPIMNGLCSLARNRGDYAAARAAAREFRELARGIGDRLNEALSIYMAGYVALAQGEYDEAETLATQASELLEEIDQRRWLAVVQTGIGEAALGAGDLERAGSLFETALTGHRALGDQYNAILTLGYLGLVRTEQGRSAEAAALFRDAIDGWQASGNWENIAEWLAQVGTLAAGMGHAALAARLFGAATTLRESLGHAFVYPGRASFERAEHAAQRDLGDDRFLTARQEAIDTPIEAMIEEAKRFLIGTAQPSGDRSAKNHASSVNLTARESDVLRLLVEGKTDREIADALFIGPRTVQTHVSNLLAKLDVANRGEAAVVAVRTGLV